MDASWTYGVPGRARLFEVVQKVREVNALRKSRAPGRTLTGASSHDPEVKANPSLALDYLVAPPQTEFYMKRSTQIFGLSTHIQNTVSMPKIGFSSKYMLEFVAVKVLKDEIHKA